MPKPLIQVAVALVRRDAQWLVARRPAGAHLAGLWEFPGGKCEPREVCPDTAMRELREECGVVATAERALAPVAYEYADRRVQITPVVCCWRSGEARPVESDACRWVSLEEMRSLEMPPVNAEIIRELEQVLSSP